MEVTIFVERPYLLAQDFRVEERFGFDSHLPGDRIRRHTEKTKGNNQHRTSNLQHPTARQSECRMLNAECRMGGKSRKLKAEG
jgi:hypothetical protein